MLQKFLVLFSMAILSSGVFAAAERVVNLDVGVLKAQPTPTTPAATIIKIYGKGGDLMVLGSDGVEKAAGWSLSPSVSAITALNIDWGILKSSGGIYTKTLSANSTFTFSSLAAGQIINVRLTNTASNYTVTWPTVKWPGGITPVQTVGAKGDVYSFIYDGVSIYGAAVQNF